MSYFHYKKTMGNVKSQFSLLRSISPLNHVSITRKMPDDSQKVLQAQLSLRVLAPVGSFLFPMDAHPAEHFIEPGTVSH